MNKLNEGYYVPSEVPVDKPAAPANEPGSAVLFKNTYKSNESQPDFTGTHNVSPDESYKISAWKRTAKNGSHYLLIKKATQPVKDPQREEKSAFDF